MFAADGSLQNGIQALVPDVDGAIQQVKEDNFEKATESFQAFKKNWSQMKGDMREQSPDALGKIETKMATVSVSLLNHDKQKAEESLQLLKSVLNQYSQGYLEKNEKSVKKMTITAYISLLQQAKQSLTDGDMAKAKAEIEALKSQWLSIEGDVVSQSKTVYNNAEQRLVQLSSYMEEAGGVKKATAAIDAMTRDLEPLSQASYGMWDAALIPIREGVEALLVVGALLTFSKKANMKRGGTWIWGGTITGLLASLAVGFLVSYALSAAAFGQNNFLINGLSGVIASLMLLYVSHWLHRNANVKRWNAFMNQKTEQAISNGKAFSFAALAFLAILREGVETVIFLVGMVHQMSMSELAAGIAVGFGVLLVIGVLMLKLSVRLPLKPFFLASSLIIFYMCIKFMGSGIHSLQLSGMIPSAGNDMLPTISFLGMYPSWYSALPQFAVILLSLVIVLMQRKPNRRKQVSQEAV